MRKFALTTIFYLLVACAAFAAEPHHALVEIDLSSPGAANLFGTQIGRLDVVQMKPGSFARILVRPDELQRLRDAGLAPRILEPDMESVSTYGDKGVGFGIYHTWSEGVAFMDSLRLLHPEIVSAKWSLGQSHEGRDLWAFRISDNPDVDEDEPEVMLDAVHHAREIMASEFVLMFAQYLAENYGVDPEVTWLVDNRELYLVPVVNPDGLVYNESNYPNGGGMWRKNRLDNGDGTFGVDLNRNYPYQWGYDDNGSSPTTWDETYRGSAPGSEPEIQALMNFINGREIRTHDTIHTYSDLLLYPWGYIISSTPDVVDFQYIADQMTLYNGYTPGQPGSILYDVNGGSFDWAYGASGEHAPIMSVSTEIGADSDGFWPSEARREPLFQENLWPHLFLMRTAGLFVVADDPVVTASTKSVAPGGSATLDFTLTNQSVFEDAPGLDLTVATDDPWIQFETVQATAGPLATRATATLGAGALPFSVDPACPVGHRATCTVTLHQPRGDLDWPLVFPLGDPIVVFSDDMEGGTGNWTRTGSWGLTGTSYQSAANSLTDSPGGAYSPNTFSSATLNGYHRAVYLTFWQKYSLETDRDFGKVQVSTDGFTWKTLAAYTGTNYTWHKVTLDLFAYEGQDIRVRFLMETDGTLNLDGWYLDDVVLSDLPHPSTDLATPASMAPGEGVTVGATPQLTVAPGAGSIPDPTVYGFRIYADELCTQAVATADDVPTGGEETSWTAPALANGDYWWRAWAGDGTERSLLCPAVGFTVEGLSPVDGTVVAGPSLRILGSVTGSAARLELNLPSRTDVAVDIYDARGARIRRLADESFAAGPRVLVWDGRDDGGRAAASGVYFVRVKAGREILTDRVVMVR